MFNYKWYLKDNYNVEGIEQHKSNVFSLFSCCGGSTMGYKLAGYNVLGCCELDKEYFNIYVKNHKPKYAFNESVVNLQTKDLPDELFDLDILDGSPPCKAFSIAGKREKNWDKEIVFKAGQPKQNVDKLFFETIKVVNRLQPKICVFENVPAINIGDAKKYHNKVINELNIIGYDVNSFVLNSRYMGVPQARSRLFFIAMRRDLSEKFKNHIGIYNSIPEIDLKFNEKEITYSEIEELSPKEGDYKHITPCYLPLWELAKPGESLSKYHPRGMFFTKLKVSPDKPLATLTCHTDDNFHYNIKRTLTSNEHITSSTFPQDFDFINNNYRKVVNCVGRAVPPVMMAQLSNRIYQTYLKPLKEQL